MTAMPGLCWCSRWGVALRAAVLALMSLVATADTHSASAGDPAVASADARWLLVAQSDPPCLVVLEAALMQPVRTIALASRDGRSVAGIAAMRAAPLRKSFIVAPAGLAELWEISYDPQAEDIFDGLVHDYRMGEGVPRRGFLALRRSLLPEPIVDFAFDVHEAEAWGIAAPPPLGSGEGQVINLDVRRRVAVVPAAQVRTLIARMQSIERIEGGSKQSGQRRTESRSWPCVMPNLPRQ